VKSNGREAQVPTAVENKKSAQDAREPPAGMQALRRNPKTKSRCFQPKLPAAQSRIFRTTGVVRKMAA